MSSDQKNAEANLVRDTLAMLLKQRRYWVTIEDASPTPYKVQFNRPTEYRMLALQGGVTLEDVVEHACDWQGVTPAHLIGPAGGGDELPFNRELFTEWARDNVTATTAFVSEMARRITEHLKKKTEAGNG